MCVWCEGEAIPSKRFERFFVRGRGETRGELVLVSELGFRIVFEERNKRKERKERKREKERLREKSLYLLPITRRCT